MQIYVSVILLLIVGRTGGELKAYNNPLNNKAVDLFLLVDENNARLTNQQLGQMKIALNTIAGELQPVGSSPYFGVYFYGATPTVHTVVPFMTGYAAVVRSNLELKQYTTGSPNPSTVISALNLVESSCQTSCRSNIPRVTVIFTTNPEYSSESRIRQLENNRGMTVIVVGIGHSVNMDTLFKLASHPSRINAISFDSFTEFIVSAPFVTSVISNVPRLLSVSDTVSVSSTSSGIYYIMQLNTYGYITSNDTVITYTTNCNECNVFASLSEPNPTSVNSIQNVNRQYFSAPGYTYSVFYFRIPKTANRFFLSFLGTGMASVTGKFNIFSMPTMMSF